jgi:hypothetical protein
MKEFLKVGWKEQLKADMMVWMLVVLMVET